MMGIAGLGWELPDISLRELYHICYGAYQHTADIVSILWNINSKKKLSPEEFNPFSGNQKSIHRGDVKVSLVSNGGDMNIGLMNKLFE